MTHSFPTRRSSDLLIHDAKNSIDPASPAADKTDRIRTRGMPMGRKRENPGLGGRPVKHLGAVLACLIGFHALPARSEEHTSELQSLMRNSYAVFCLKKKKENNTTHQQTTKI